MRGKVTWHAQQTIGHKGVLSPFYHRQYRLIFVLQIRKCLIGCDRISRRSFYDLHWHINPYFHSQMQTGTHKLSHKDTHSAVLSSCHPPAKSTGEKHHSTLGNKLIHVSQINSDWEQAERLWQCCCFFPWCILWKLVLGSQTLIGFIMKAAETNIIF